MIRGREFEPVPGSGLGLVDRARGKFKHGVGGKTRRKPPGKHSAPDLLHPLLAIEIDEVDRKLHPKSMNGFTGNDPEALSGRKAIAPQEALSARCPMVGDLYAVGKYSLPGRVPDLQPGIWLRPVASGKTVPYPSSEVHDRTLAAYLNKEWSRFNDSCLY
jgi:hypothetical protein